MSKKSGSVIGGMLLIAGSCIGAGMLGLPIVTGLSGFFPSLGIFFLAWVFMTATGLLLVEANSWFSSRVNLLSMAEKTLGRWGQRVCWVTYLFLFYALLLAYLSQSSSIFSSFAERSLSMAIPSWVGSSIFVFVFGGIIYMGTRSVDHVNRVLMVGKVGCFLLLIVAAAHFVQPELLLRSAPEYALGSLPLLVIAFGFHNMIPSLTSYLGGNLKRVRWTIVGGSLLAFAIYLIWEILVLGIVPFEGANGILDSLQNDREAAQAIGAIVGSPSIRLFSQGLAFFAILTSFLAQGLSLVHFLADGLKKQEGIGLCALALLPPFCFSLLYPQLFFAALNFAGGICAVILFGMMPVAMIWIGRYRQKLSSGYSLRGGKTTLVAIFLVACLIFALQLKSMLS